MADNLNGKKSDSQLQFEKSRTQKSSKRQSKLYYKGIMKIIRLLADKFLSNI